VNECDPTSVGVRADCSRNFEEMVNEKEMQDFSGVSLSHIFAAISDAAAAHCRSAQQASTQTKTAGFPPPFR
jgi:hypothetical protein